MRAANELHYAQAAAEYDAGHARPSLITMVEAQVDADPVCTRAGYIRVRAAELAASEPDPHLLNQPALPPPSVTRAPVPPPRMRSSILSTLFVVAGVVLFGAGLVYVYGGRSAPDDTVDLVAMPAPTPRPVMVSDPNCRMERPDISGDDLGEILSSTINSALTNPALVVTMRVRNDGVEGDIDVASYMRQTVAPRHASQRNSVRLRAGEERVLTHVYPEVVGGALGECWAWAVLPGTELAALDPPNDPAPSTGFEQGERQRTSVAEYEQTMRDAGAPIQPNTEWEAQMMIDSAAAPVDAMVDSTAMTVDPYFGM